MKPSFERAAVRAAGIVLVGAACLFCVPAAAAPADEDRITVNFVNADIQSVIKVVGQHTGRNFILDPRVTGTVNIVSDKPVSKDMLYQILLSTLRVQGYAAVEGDGFVKIVPEAEAKTSATPISTRTIPLPRSWRLPGPGSAARFHFSPCPNDRG